MGDRLPPVRHLCDDSCTPQEGPVSSSRCLTRCGPGLTHHSRSSRAALIRVTCVASVHCSRQRKGDVGDHRVLIDEWQYTTNACAMVEPTAHRSIKYCSRYGLLGNIRGFKIWCRLLDIDEIRPASWPWSVPSVCNAQETMSDRNRYAGWAERYLVDHAGFQHSEEEHQATNTLKSCYGELRDTRIIIGSDGL